MSVGVKKMPYMLKNGELNTDTLTQKLVSPVTKRDQYFADIYRTVTEQIPRASDGTYNSTAAMMAALVLSRSEMLADSVGTGTFSYDIVVAAYAVAEWGLGRRWVDHDDWVGENALDDDVVAEYQMPNEPSVRAANEWYPGKQGRPPKGAVRNYGRIMQLGPRPAP